ncbi:SDR family NAD(P)-dependent oxidoreductase [Niveispirillum fermenti]|uniref:SDR family NAD(P)-dependent oxidoreductase n=1 Tax=Niveispirillum fermenti TaxID=1233113 RepID=UPI003A88C35A
MAERLAGKVAVITGASRGLGQYCALGYAAEGATVIVAARSSQEAGPGTVEMIRQAGGNAFAVSCDVGDPASITGMVGTVLDRVGRIDLLMTNAAYFAPGTLSTIDMADWDRQFRVNVDGVFHAIRAVLPAMNAQGGGNIITVSSVAAQKASHYGLTKRAVVGMTLGFAAEQRQNGIAVNALRPVAAIRTPGWLASRDPAVLKTREHRVSPPDSYVEAAILLGMRTADTCTGRELSDAEVIRLFGKPGDYERFKTMNAQVWGDDAATRLAPGACG